VATHPESRPFAGRLLAALAGLAVAACCVSCASSKGGKPTKICGKTVDRDPAGAVADDATTHDITVNAASVHGLILLRTAPGCRTGADVAIEPSGAADIINDVRGSKDKRYIAVELQPHRDAFTVRVTRSSTSVSVVTVEGLTVETPTAPVSP
jgi:hypothetical protein